MDAWSVLVEATMRAAAETVKARDLNVDVGQLTDALKITLKASIADILAEWQDAIAANLSEPWLRELLNAQATELARQAVELAKEGGGR